MTNAIMYLNEAFPDYKFEDITPKLRTYTYKVYQHQNYDNTSKILIAERNEVTEEVFKTRDMGNLDYDIIIMRHGAYRVFNSALIQNFHNSIKVFITERF
jgi:hypothetical protein